MTLRHLLADLRMFFAFFLALYGVAEVIHGTMPIEWLVGAAVGGVGFASLFLVWLAAEAGEK